MTRALFDEYQKLAAEKERDHISDILHIFVDGKLEVAESLINHQDCSSDCYKCYYLGWGKKRLLDELLGFLNEHGI